MPIPGRRAFDEIREALNRAQAQVEQVESAERSVKSEIEQLVSDRGAALLDLARHDLPDLRRESIQATFEEIQADLLQIADRKERTIAEQKGRVERLQADEAQRGALLTKVEERVASLAGDVSQLQNRVQEELHQDADFSLLSQQAVTSEAELHRDEKRVADVLTGAQEKLPNYEKSALFQYLYRRRFETPEYLERGWTRQFDRWVGRLIGYTKAKRGYEFLKKTPAMMQVELERRRSEFHQLMSRVEEIEASYSARLGLTAVTGQLAAEQAERETHHKALVELRQRIGQAQTVLAGVSQAQCQFYHAALDRYRAFLEETQTAVLERHARATQSPHDDEIVSRIRFLTDQIGRLQPRVQELADELASVSGVSDGLEFIVRRMRQSNFESERSRFSDRLNLDQLLSRFRARAISREAVWTELKENQEFERTQAEATVVDIVNHPVTRVLAEAMVQAVGSALQNGVNRSLQRRSGTHGSGWPFDPASGNNSGRTFPEGQTSAWVRMNPPAAASTPPAPSANPAPPANPAGNSASTGDGEYRTVDRF